MKDREIIGVHKEMNKDRKGRKKWESHPSNQNKRKLFKKKKKKICISAEVVVRVFLESQFTL